MKNHRYGFAVFALAGLLSTIVACSDYSHMKDNMDNMSDKTNSMEKKTNQLSEDSCELYDALRQGNTLTIRRDSINNLLNGTRQEAAKISEAGPYFMAFEFQLWSDRCQDNSETKRDKLMAVAAQEFLRQVQEFYADNDLSPDPSATSDGSGFTNKNLHAIINALAATLHELNPKQEMRKAANPDFKTYSMLDILENGLAAKADLNSGKMRHGTEPEYVKEVLMQEKYAVALLQARYNMAVAIVIDGISHIRDGFFNQVMMFLKPWDANLKSQNLVQITEYQKYVNGANEVHDFLLKIGEKPELNKMFKKVLENMRYTPDKSRSTVLLTEEERLVQMIKDYANH